MAAHTECDGASCPNVLACCGVLPAVDHSLQIFLKKCVSENGRDTSLRQALFAVPKLQADICNRGLPHSPRVNRMRLPVTYSATTGFFLLAASFSAFFITFRFFDMGGLRSVLASHSVRPGRASLQAEVRHSLRWLERMLPTKCAARITCRWC
jgi:hypothetical protein